LIDLIDEVGSADGSNNSGEVQRLKALAQTSVEDAAMWAVKAATKPEWAVVVSGTEYYGN
jgi:hypothetical protein